MSQEAGSSPPGGTARGDIAAKLDAFGWGAFFLWVGFALLVDVGWGIGLVGVGLITLAEQLARRSYGLAVEGFWVFIGVCFLLGGLWELYRIELPLLAILLVILGVAIIVSAFRGRHLGRR